MDNELNIKFVNEADCKTLKEQVYTVNEAAIIAFTNVHVFDNMDYHVISKITDHNKKELTLLLEEV